MNGLLRVEAPTDPQLALVARLCEERGFPQPAVYSRTDAGVGRRGRAVLMAANDHGLHVFSREGRRLILHQARCECGWESSWYVSEDLACGEWEDHLSRRGTSVDALLTAKGRA